jgi:hypothetical protein
LGAKLDDTIRAIIKEMSNSNTISNAATKRDISLEELRDLQSRSLEYASNGNLEQLRELSRKSQQDTSTCK